MAESDRINKQPEKKISLFTYPPFVKLFLPNLLRGPGADTDWAEMNEQQKKDILKLAWQMGVRAGIRRKDKPEKVPEMETGMAEEQTE